MRNFTVNIQFAKSRLDTRRAIKILAAARDMAIGEYIVFLVEQDLENFPDAKKLCTLSESTQAEGS